MIIRNVKVFQEDKSFKEGSIYIHNGLFGDEENVQDGDVLDGNGAYAVPGLIDLHFHGCMGYDFCDGTKEAIARIARYELEHGVTAISPATMTLPVEELKSILSTAADYKEEAEEGADLIGINMEGPFISVKKKGAQNGRYIMPCSCNAADEFLKASKGLVKFIGIAPEESENSADFIQKMKDKVHITLAHTNADYATAKMAFDAGADHVVHLYNAMPPLSHRAPGVIGAAADAQHVMAEIICDGVHIHPSMVRAAFKLFGDERMMLISDSMRATGLEDGVYSLGGLDVKVEGNHATLVEDGALAGSVTNLLDCMRIAVTKMDIPLGVAVACATINPAKCLDVYDLYGSIAPGKKGNVVLLDESLNLQAVIKDGKRIV